MLRRAVDVKLNKWVETSKKALIVSGARQVGKTFSIRECLRNHQCNYIEINLIDKPEMVAVLEKAMTVDDLIIGITSLMDYKFVEGETIVFIDEVQQLKDIITRIKFWVEDGRFRYILSGSLLGVEMRNLRSAPVGYVQMLTMYPLNFEEYLIASGVVDDTITYLKACFDQRKEVGEGIHDKILKHFYRYLVVGGMPEAVREYVETGDMNVVTEIQQSIIAFYKKDFTKYESENKKLYLEAIYNTIPSNLLKQNKRFNYSDIGKGFYFEKTENSFIWLTSAGVTIPAYNATEPRLALEQNKKSSLVKLYNSDVGLLTSMYGNSVRAQILLQNDKMNLGGVFENAVVQQLTAHGFPAYFYNSHKLGELDFVIEYKGRILPIEVKSGKDYYIHSALDNVLLNREYEIEEAFIFANCDVQVDQNKIYLPVYMSTFLQDDMVLPILDPII
jgi:predicted AAA+ superfamily ATPase